MKRIAGLNWLFYMLAAISLWFLSFYLFPRTLGDSIFSAGPALGLMNHWRLVDTLNWDNWEVYFGHPPIYFLYEIPFFFLFGATLKTTYAIVLSLLLIYGVFLYHLLRKFTTDVFKISIIIFIALSSNYLISGRVDLLANIFLVMVLLLSVSLVDSLSIKKSILCGVVMALCFLTHPLAGALAALSFTLVFFLNVTKYKPRYYLITGFVAFLCTSIFYAPYIYVHFDVFTEHFLSLAVGQNHFYAPNLFKYIFYNLGFFGILLIVSFRFFRDRISKQETCWLIVSGCSLILIFFFGMSYYYVYCQPVLCILIISNWNKFQLVKNLLLQKIMIYGFCAVATFQGPVSIIIQSLRSRPYIEDLILIKKEFKKIVSEYPDHKIIADASLVVEILDNPNARNFWHAFANYRDKSYLNDSLIFAFTTKSIWEANKSLLGEFGKSPKFELIYYKTGADGLPSSYFLKSDNEEMNLWIVKSK